MMLSRRLKIGGGGAPSTLGIVDIFGDGSGIALYQLDGNANDTGGNYNGTPTAISYAEAKFSDGGVLNGSTSVIAVPHNDAFNSDNGSYSGWFNTSDVDADIHGLIWKCPDTTPNTSIGISCTVDGSIKIQFGNGSSAFISLSTFATNSIDYRDGVWHHFCVIKEYGTGDTLSIYMDGAFIVSSQFSTEHVLQNTNEFVFGKVSSASTAARYFKGSIDQFRIFNKALSGSEVLELYNEK